MHANLIMVYICNRYMHTCINIYLHIIHILYIHTLIHTLIHLNFPIIRSSPVLCLTIGYGFAWVGHFFFELNRPATFTYPALSIMGDFRLWYEIAKYGLSLLVPTPHTS